MNSSDFKFFFTRFLVLFSMFILLFLGIFTYHSKQELASVKSNMKVEQNALLEGKKNYIEWVIGSVVKETALLADLLGQQKIYKAGTELDEQTKSQLLQHTSNALLAMSQRKEIYDQIRYLDLEGNEIVRVNFYDGKAHLIAKDELQNKAHRYYFQKALALGCNQVYVSPIDLNMEHGMIEVPHKPMIRMATPVVDEQGQKRGIVIINYLAKYLMDGLRLFNLDSGTNYMLINNSGYFLFNDERPDLEFAFMFEDKQDQTVYTMFPKLAERIKTTVSGQLESETGIMTVESVGAIDRVNPYCFQDFHVSNNDTTSWKLVSYADFEKRIDVQHPTAFHGSMIQLGVLLSIVLALCIATYQLRLNRDDRRIHYLAHYDSLTGLYNRGAFQAKSLEAVKKANKDGNPVCLVFIDLDDFKAINDSYSHRGGDIALQHVAKAIQSVYGEQAIIGRIGGDEFAVLLHQSLIFEQAQQYADELLDVVKRPFEVEPDVKIQVSTSIGGHYCQDSCCDSDDLIHKADIAMYQAKAAGKGCVVILDCIDASSQT